MTSNRGREPRLRYGMPRGYVVARDPQNGKILLGGLGALLVGLMWKDESEDDRTREGYDEAPMRMWPGAHEWE